MTAPLQPSKFMIDEGAQRLASFGDDSVWPESWTPAEIATMRNVAERVWRSMLLAHKQEMRDLHERMSMD